MLVQTQVAAVGQAPCLAATVLSDYRVKSLKSCRLPALKDVATICSGLLVRDDLGLSGCDASSCRCNFGVAFLGTLHRTLGGIQDHHLILRHHSYHFWSAPSFPADGKDPERKRAASTACVVRQTVDSLMPYVSPMCACVRYSRQYIRVSRSRSSTHNLGGRPPEGRCFSNAVHRSRKVVGRTPVNRLNEGDGLSFRVA